MIWYVIYDIWYMIYDITWYMTWHGMACHVIYHISYHIISHRIVSYIISYHTKPYHTIQYHTYRIVSYHIISYHTLYIKRCNEGVCLQQDTTYNLVHIVCIEIYAQTLRPKRCMMKIVIGSLYHTVCRWHTDQGFLMLCSKNTGSM